MDNENPEAEEILATTLKDIRQKADDELQHPVDLTSISIPQHFNDSIRGAISKPALNLEPGIVRPWQVRQYYNAVRLAYRLNSCEAFGLNSTTCDVEDGPHLIFFVDCNDTYLELYIADVTRFIFTKVAKETLRNPGARRFVASNADIKTDWAKIRYELQGFVDKHFGARQGYQDIEDLRAIILSGDAPPTAFENIRTIVVDLLPGQVDKIRDTLDPLYVGAVGAAQWARIQIQDTKILKDISTDTMISDTYAHDEL
ncbi:MAG: hypothetical protein Q9160_002250 [Pyrenula sp. 1 TL-2023]